ncbi:hypothetical protein [Botrimarina sp.]|uniref:hypothetical protein n=1 Tax=Botrimarina sp. TaxID=2795802 RepID=UPI0032F055AE
MESFGDSPLRWRLGVVRCVTAVGLALATGAAYAQTTATEGPPAGASAESSATASSSSPADGSDAESQQADSGRRAPIDWSTIPDGVAPPKQGYGYRGLNRQQIAALRREVHLPLAALASARSPQDLQRSLRVAKLPDPDEPLLPVGPAVRDARDPFGGERLASFRQNPMQALGESLGVDLSAEAAPLDSATNPFGVQPAAPTGDAPAAAEDPFAAGAPAAGDSDASDDPFAF